MTAAADGRFLFPGHCQSRPTQQREPQAGFHGSSSRISPAASRIAKARDPSWVASVIRIVQLSVV